MEAPRRLCGHPRVSECYAGSGKLKFGKRANLHGDGALSYWAPPHRREEEGVEFQESKNTARENNHGRRVSGSARTDKYGIRVATDCDVDQARSNRLRYAAERRATERDSHGPRHVCIYAV